jgi:hypothetical protein
LSFLLSQSGMKMKMAKLIQVQRKAMTRKPVKKFTEKL